MKWEYLNTYIRNGKQLDHYGLQGWELVTVYKRADLDLEIGYCIFKRQTNEK